MENNPQVEYFDELESEISGDLKSIKENIQKLPVFRWKQGRLRRSTLTRRLFQHASQSGLSKEQARKLALRIVKNMAYLIDVDMIRAGDKFEINFEEDTARVKKRGMEDFINVDQIVWGDALHFRGLASKDLADALSLDEDEAMKEALERGTIFTVYSLRGVKAEDFWAEYNKDLKRIFNKGDSYDVRKLSAGEQMKAARAMKEYIRKEGVSVIGGGVGEPREASGRRGIAPIIPDEIVSLEGISLVSDDKELEDEAEVKPAEREAVVVSRRVVSEATEDPVPREAASAHREPASLAKEDEEGEEEEDKLAPYEREIIHKFHEIFKESLIGFGVDPDKQVFLGKFMENIRQRKSVEDLINNNRKIFEEFVALMVVNMKLHYSDNEELKKLYFRLRDVKDRVHLIKVIFDSEMFQKMRISVTEGEKEVEEDYFEDEIKIEINGREYLVLKEYVDVLEEMGLDTIKNIETEFTPFGHCVSTLGTTAKGIPEKLLRTIDSLEADFVTSLSKDMPLEYLSAKNVESIDLNDFPELEKVRVWDESGNWSIAYVDREKYTHYEKGMLVNKRAAMDVVAVPVSESVPIEEEREKEEVSAEEKNLMNIVRTSSMFEVYKEAFGYDKGPGSLFYWRYRRNVKSAFNNPRYRRFFDAEGVVGPITNESLRATMDDGQKLFIKRAMRNVLCKIIVEKDVRTYEDIDRVLNEMQVEKAIEEEDEMEDLDDFEGVITDEQAKVFAGLEGHADALGKSFWTIAEDHDLFGVKRWFEDVEKGEHVLDDNPEDNGFIPFSVFNSLLRGFEQNGLTDHAVEMKEFISDLKKMDQAMNLLFNSLSTKNKIEEMGFREYFSSRGIEGEHERVKVDVIGGAIASGYEVLNAIEINVPDFLKPFINPLERWPNDSKFLEFVNQELDEAKVLLEEYDEYARDSVPQEDIEDIGETTQLTPAQAKVLEPFDNFDAENLRPLLLKLTEEEDWFGVKGFKSRREDDLDYIGWGNDFGDEGSTYNILHEIRDGFGRIPAARSDNIDYYLESMEKFLKFCDNISKILSHLHRIIMLRKTIETEEGFDEYYAGIKDNPEELNKYMSQHNDVIIETMELVLSLEEDYLPGFLKPFVTGNTNILSVKALVNFVRKEKARWDLIYRKHIPE
jgi:hypothetical protein